MEPDSLADYEKKHPNLKKVTLCYLVNNDRHEVLLAMKKRGFGEGWWNGVGGKLNDGETVEEALIRETREEIGVELISFKKIGVIAFYFEGAKASGFDQEVNVYLADSWRGSPKESEEMRPQWFNMDKLPFDMMWPDDRYWLGNALKGNYISASFLFDSNGNIKENNIGPRPKVRIR